MSWYGAVQPNRKMIPLVILEEGSYEKDVLFYVNLGEPQMVGGNVLKLITCIHTYTNIELYFPMNSYKTKWIVKSHRSAQSRVGARNKPYFQFSFR